MQEEEEEELRTQSLLMRVEQQGTQQTILEWRCWPLAAVAVAAAVAVERLSSEQQRQLLVPRFAAHARVFPP